MAKGWLTGSRRGKSAFIPLGIPNPGLEFLRRDTVGARSMEPLRSQLILVRDFPFPLVVTPAEFVVCLNPFLSRTEVESR